MFHNNQLITAISADRQTRLRNAATRQRLMRRNKAPSADSQSARLVALDWSADTDLLLSQPRAHCVA
jgi:hypothetical protein